MFLKNRNIISKMKRSKVTDYAALNDQILFQKGTLRDFLVDDDVSVMDTFITAISAWQHALTYM